MMSRSLSLALLAATLAAPSPALAQDPAQALLTPYAATVMHEPELALLLSDPLGSPHVGAPLLLYGPRDLAAPLRALVEEPAFHAKRAVTIYLDAGRSLRALGGTTAGEVPLLDDAGRRRGAQLEHDARVVVYGLETHPSGRVMLRVSTGDRLGWMHRQHVTIGSARPLAEWAGRELAGPVVCLLTRLKGERLFHPDGHMFRGTITPVVSPGSPFATTARRLRGDVLARIGGGLWNLDPETGEESDLPDGVSFALQIKAPGAALDTTTGADDQHLTLVSGARTWRALLTETVTRSDPHSFFNNAFHTTTSYEVQGETVSVRLVPDEEPYHPRAQDRIGGVREAIAAGRAFWFLQVRAATSDGEPSPWYTLARLDFTEELPDQDQDGFHVSTELAGRGLHPNHSLGEVLRHGAYPSAQRCRRQGEDPPVSSALDADPRAPVPTGPGLTGALGEGLGELGGPD